MGDYDENWLRNVQTLISNRQPPFLSRYLIFVNFNLLYLSVEHVLD